MRHALPLYGLAVLGMTLSGCSPTEQADEAQGTRESAAAVAPAPDETTSRTSFPEGTWEMASSGEGDGLFFGAEEGKAGAMHLFCPADGGFLVNVNSFRPIGSEERMTLGSGAKVFALVADPAGDTMRGGVSGQGPVPAELLAVLTGTDGVAASYGAQDIGPLPPVPEPTARLFVTGCTD